MGLVLTVFGRAASAEFPRRGGLFRAPPAKAAQKHFSSFFLRGRRATQCIFPNDTQARETGQLDIHAITAMIARENTAAMHEFGIMQSTLETAAQKTRAAGATQVHRLRLRVGKLSGVVPEALRFAFDALKEKTVAAQAELEMEEVTAACWCAGCAAEFESADLKYECPRCHQPSGDLRRGKEMELALLEIS